jgi:hypothetical protein
MNGSVYLMESQILRRRLFLICSDFFGANSLAKNVSEKQHMFCLQTQNPISTPALACSASGRPGGHFLTGFSLADAPLCVSQTKMQQMRAWRQAATELRRWQVELEGGDEVAIDRRASDESSLD